MSAIENKIGVTVVIPVYRSTTSLEALYQRLVSVFVAQGISFDIIFVEDCGGDNAWEIIKRLTDQDVRVHGLRMSRNYGQHNALLAGIRAATGDWIVTIDDDLQHLPEELPKLFSKINEGYDVVYGAPESEKHGFFRNLASKITKIALQNAMGAETARYISALRVFRTELREAFIDYRSPTVNIDVLLTWATMRFGVCFVQRNARQYGKSGYTARQLLRHAINMMTGFSTIPLKIATILGMLCALFGVGVLAYVLLGYFFNDQQVAGFPFLASIIAIFSGAQLLALGIIGEYLGRMHQRTMERPPYLLREIIGRKG